jgi:type II secretory pathway component PulF
MQFNYQARTKNGEVQAGTVEASSREAALTLLQRHQLFVTFLEQTKKQPFYVKKIKLFEKISRKDIVTFSRQLSLMFQSKIPLLEALQTLAEQNKKPNFKEKILALAEDIEGGTPFSQALSAYPKLFSPFYVSMVKSGEASGTLSESLSYLAGHLEREYHLISKIQGAMIYPALIVVVVIGVLVMMMFFVIPNMTKILVETGQDLPLVTKIVIGLSDFLRSWGWLVFLFLGGIFISLFRYLKTVSGKKLWDRLVLHLPLVGPFLKMVYLSRFAENLSTLAGGGLPIVQALEITAEIVGNNVYQNIVAETKEEVKKGEKISRVLSRHAQYFPPILTQMVTVGEKTGALDTSLMNVVEFYRQEIDRAIDNLLSILEPVLVIFLGLIVAGLMGAVLMPLYRMTAL